MFPAVDIPVGTISGPILADIFLYSYEAEFIVFALDGKETASHFNFTYRHIDDVLFIDDRDFESDVSTIRFAILNTRSKTRQRATLLLLTGFHFLPIGREGQLHAPFYDQRNYFNFYITIFPFLSRSILASST